MTTTNTLREIKRSNASRNYLEHIDETVRAMRALSLEELLFGNTTRDARDLATEIEEARGFCEAIGGTEGEVLKRHYIEGYTYTDIARDMAYSERQITRFAMRGRVAMFDYLEPYWQHSVLLAS